MGKMRVVIELEREDFDAMHDVIFEVKGYQPTDEQIQTIWDSLPEDIQGHAITYGSNDILFIEDLYDWLYQN